MKKFIAIAVVAAMLLMIPGTALAGSGVKGISVRIAKQWTEISDTDSTVTSNFTAKFTNSGANAKNIRCWFDQVTEDHVWLNDVQINLKVSAGATVRKTTKIVTSFNPADLWWIQHAGTHVDFDYCEKAWAAPAQG